jgi:hypothetical protein
MVAAATNVPVVLVVRTVLLVASQRAHVLADVIVPASLAMIAFARVLIVPGQLLVVLTTVGPILVPITTVVLSAVVVPASIRGVVAIILRLIITVAIAILLVLPVPAVIPAAIRRAVAIILGLVIPVAIAILLVPPVPAVIATCFAVLLAIALPFVTSAIVGQVPVQIGAIAVLPAFLVQLAVLVIGDIVATGFREPMAALGPVWSADSVPSPAAGNLADALAQGTAWRRVVGRPAHSTEAWSELRA